MKLSAFVFFRILAATLLFGPAVDAAEIIVLSSAVTRSAISEIAQQFERNSGHKVALRFANNPILMQQIEADTQFDVVILEPDMIDRLAALAKTNPKARIDLARVGMALGARAGTSKPDISRVEPFSAFLKSADSIAYTSDGHSGTVFLKTLEHLGLLDALKPKLRPAVGRTASSLVTSGEAQLWAGPISTPSPGTEIIGRFPEVIQTYVGISASLSTRALAPEEAKSFIAFLVSPEARSVFDAKGFQSIPRQ